MVAKIRPIGSGQPDISLVDAAIVTLTKELGEIRTEVRAQRSDNNTIIVGAIFAVVLIIASVAATVIITNHLTGDEFNRLFDFQTAVSNQQTQINDLQNKVSNIKTLNPYLK